MYHQERVECADEETLAELVANALPEAERAAIATHAATCSRCHALLEGLLATTGGSFTPASPDDVTRDDDAPAPSKLSLRRGDRVGRYVIEERIGAGGMGVVYAATDSELQRRVAIKLVRHGERGAISTQGRERLMREARLLASLSHPNVVTVFDVGTHEGHVFIAMELVDSGSIAAWMRSGDRSTNEILDRMIEAGRGLAAAHAGGVVHRDIKPDNILVGLDGRARVTDFGLARIDQDLAPDLDEARAATLSPNLTKTGAFMGTPVYMPPEQSNGGDVDARSDQWAFCATLYELVAGVRPFSVDDATIRSAEIETGRIAEPAEGHSVPGWLRRIIARGLHAKPPARWGSMNAVVDQLVRGRQRRTRRALALGAVIVVTAVAGIGFAATRHSKARPLTEAEKRNVASSNLAWVDERPGCSCPFSNCVNGACVSVCNMTDFDFAHRKDVPGIAVVHEQEAIVGVSASEDALLYLGGKDCALDRLMLARRAGATYVPTDLTDRIDLTRGEIAEGCCTIAADGKTALVISRDHQRFHRLSLATMELDDGAETAGLLPSHDKGLELHLPVLSSDELTIYYSVTDRVASPEEAGPLEGLYSSTRASTSVPFPIGTKLPWVARPFSAVSGESSDHLTLFLVGGDWRTHVLTRSRRDEKFGVASPGVDPALIQGWRAIPSADCQRLYITDTPGGCRQENIAILPAIHRPPLVPAR